MTLEASFIFEFVCDGLGAIDQKVPRCNLPHASGLISPCASSDTPLSNGKLTGGEPGWKEVFQSPDGRMDERARSSGLTQTSLWQRKCFPEAALRSHYLQSKHQEITYQVMSDYPAAP